MVPLKIWKYFENSCLFIFIKNNREIVDLVYSLVHKFDNTSTKIQTLKSGNATFIFKPPAYILCSNQQRCHRMIGWWRSTQIYVLTPSGVITLVRVKMALACKYFYFLFGWWVYCTTVCALYLVV